MDKTKNYVVAPGHMKYEVRTDLAVEEKESFPGDGGEITGVSLREWHDKGSCVKLTEVKILDKRGAKSMGKPMGTYLTLEAEELIKKDEGYHEEVSKKLGQELRKLLQSMGKGKEGPQKILTVGLGNPGVTPDSLGPQVLNHLQVTRQWNQEYGEDFCARNHLPELSGIIPGVMAQTGMETAEILKGIIRETKPDVLLVIDALAARSIKRLGTTIQLTDTGIHPGSGVGNHRKSLTKESLGVPVLAIGVPTVVSAAAIVHDTIHAMISVLNKNDSTKGMGAFVEEMEPEEQYRLIRELLEPEFGPMYVTPPDIDETIGRLSFTISEGIHGAVFPKDEL